MKIYIPLLYSEKIKRPDKQYFLYSILGEDFLILLLSFVYHSSHPWSNAIGIFLLQISFWCIYELGYIENDIIGEKFEDKAILSYNYNSYKYSFRLWQAWVWSLALSAMGTIFIGQDLVVNRRLIQLIPFSENNYELFKIGEGFLFWLSFLLVLRVLFHTYNHLNKQSRVWFYLLLQACRYCGYLALLTTNTIGLIFLASTILTRSIQYILYRYRGGESASWPMDFPRYFFCLLIYLLLMATLAANNRNLSLLFNEQVLLISVFCLARGCKHFYRVFSQLLHVSQDGSNQVS